MYGITVKNTQGHLLISSEFESMHCIGQAQFVTTTHSGLTTFLNYGGTMWQAALNGRHIHRYSIIGLAADAPMFFIKPVNIDQNHGILNQWNSGNTWYVDILQTGVISQPPIIFAFLLPSAMPVSTENYGISTFLSNGRRAFDSRLRPLAIYDAQSVIPPNIPCNGGTPTETSGHGWNDTSLDFDFDCDIQFTSYSMSTTVDNTNLMFSVPCVAQAVYRRVKHGYKRSCGFLGCCCQDHWSTATWWAMYHQTYLLNTGSINASWGMYAAGYNFSSTYEDGGWFGGGGGSISTGSQPYSPKTINLSNNTIILADARYYQ